MQGVAERLKQLRTFWCLSARRLSLDLGMNPNLWFNYENGESVPSASVLQNLASRGVDIHWLLLGQGEPFRAAQARDLPIVLESKTQQQQKALRLGQLELLAQRSNINLRVLICGRVAESEPEVGCSLDEIVTSVRASVDEVAVALLELIRDGAIQVKKNAGIERYLRSDSMVSIANSEFDSAALCLKTIRFIAADICEGLNTHALDRTVLIDGIACVKNGSEYLREVQLFLSELGQRMSSNHGDSVRVIFAAKIAEKS